jgi:tetratricopeptide (TPR) repeat protein/CHAT domain-containing protein
MNRRQDQRNLWTKEISLWQPRMPRLRLPPRLARGPRSNRTVARAAILVLAGLLTGLAARAQGPAVNAEVPQEIPAPAKAKVPQEMPATATAPEREGLLRSAGLERTAHALFARDQFDHGRACLEESLAILEWLYTPEKYPDGHPRVAAALTHLGEHLRTARRSLQALGYHRRALAISERLYPANRFPDGHVEIAKSLTNLGTALGDLMEKDRALAYHHRALAMNERLFPLHCFPDGHLTLAASLSHLGLTLMNLGEPEQALPYLRRALAADERLFPPDRFPKGHIEVAATLNNLGIVLGQLGEITEAVVQFRRALEMRVKLHPSEDFPEGQSDVVHAMANLGKFLMEKGDHTEAITNLRNAVEISERLYAQDRDHESHPLLASRLADLGTALLARGNPDQALPFLRRALAMRERLYPPSRLPAGHADLVTSLAQLGGALAALKEWDESLTSLQKALAMSERLYPPARFPNGHPEQVLVLRDLGQALQSCGERGRAIECYRRAIAILERVIPPSGYPRERRKFPEILRPLGETLYAQGDRAGGLEYLRRNLAICERLYPLEKYPHGHHELEHSLEALSRLALSREDLASILSFYLRRLETAERLFPRDRYPDGHPVLAASLDSCGGALFSHADYCGAATYYRRSLQIKERLYPPDRYPRGHSTVAAALNNLGTALDMQNEFTQSLNAFQASLRMLERLYPSSEFPQGHADLADVLQKMGAVHKDVGSLDQARACYQRALEMIERMYPKDRFPNGHDRLIHCLAETAAVQTRGSGTPVAKLLLDRALAMYEGLHPPGQSTKESTDLTSILLTLGRLSLGRGEMDRALEYYRRVAGMNEQLYSPDRYPYGHANAAVVLHNLGMLYEARGELDLAMSSFRRALTMLQNISSQFVVSASETEALNFNAHLPTVQNCLISLNERLARKDPRIYGLVSGSKASITRIVQRRQQALFLTSDPEARIIGQELAATRLELAQLALTPTGTAQGLRLKLEELTRRKEDLERRWIARLPDRSRQDVLALESVTELSRKLPHDSVFVDILAYYRHEHGLGPQPRLGSTKYIAFVTRPGQVEWDSIDLGPVEAINQAISAWREDIRTGRPGSAASTLRHLIWEPLERLFPAGIKTVWISPDGELSTIPWGAIPCREPARVLLEDYAIALVPHGPFLLEQITAERRSYKTLARLLAVGGVEYSNGADPPHRSGAHTTPDAPASGEDHLTWPDLPGTRAELTAVLEMAVGHPAVRLVGAEATPSRVLDELPRVRLAHLATHGFFADQKLRSVMGVDEAVFVRGPDLAAPGARNPLVLSGLVLAGANRPVPTDSNGLPVGNGGILTAEAIAGLPLLDLEIVVLSACETGLGIVRGGEGVFSLQRAFHVAGAQNVVASLWKVDDDATAALMTIFYDQLWRQRKPPIEALRNAQLAIYRHPELVGEFAKARGTPDFDKFVQRPGLGVVAGHDRGTQNRAPVKQWAAFVLSGFGK